MRSFVPPAKTSPPAVVSTGPQCCESRKGCVQTFLLVVRSQACSSPIWSAPGRDGHADVVEPGAENSWPGDVFMLVPGQLAAEVVVRRNVEQPVFGL